TGDTTGANEAGVGARPPSQRTTFLLSTAKGAFPDGPSRNAAVSHDQRIARYIAYESDASHNVAGDTNHTTQAFRVVRAPPYVHVLGGTGLDAGFKGLTFLASAGNNRAAGNGNSADAQIARSGKSVVFSSTSTNLIKGDKTPTADIYQRTIFRKFEHTGNGKG